MTFKDWADATRMRFRTEPMADAAFESGKALLRGAIRRAGSYMGHSIWRDDEWDVLVVLDACRYDLMQEVAPEYHNLPDDIDSWWSNASCSIDWIIRNFNECPDQARYAGYITGNPFTHHTADDARTAGLTDGDLAYLARLYETHWQPVDGGPVETIPPDVITDYGITAWRQRHEIGMDKMILHYMQPHQPYRSRPDWVGVNKNLKNLVKNRTKAGACAWQECRKGRIEERELWKAYKNNLRWVLNDITGRLLPNVDGSVVLTADHGNAMGEWGEWAHPPGAIGPAVRRVPWVRVNATDENSVTPDVDLDTNFGSDHDANDKLSSLGYL